MLKDDINKALEILNEGGIILYPTDTIWGLGCDATNEAAVERIFKLKGRDAGKSLIVLLDTENKLESYVTEVPAIAYDLIEYAENPLTIIYSGAKNLAKNVIHEDGSLGIRVAKHPFCQQLIQRFRKPIVSTSANISGEASPKNFSEIADEIKNGVDYVVKYEQDDLSEKRPSTIMKLETDGRFSFIRR
ncbi:L-threonylcarbamoyladenylate synthase [Pedobacter sp. SYSU D00535]|uniref:L-threonylcarbamoyladenylate synthase n=1 Tax=Pedobacter sp. SYSU D00535 TaxID=2810308 RepID=UPI001A961AF6|nr:L-threonylcarbamoyladenylate synthase [Pedobacter sp. SYSU D00535]